MLNLLRLPSPEWTCPSCSVHPLASAHADKAPRWHPAIGCVDSVQLVSTTAVSQTLQRIEKIAVKCRAGLVCHAQLKCAMNPMRSAPVLTARTVTLQPVACNCTCTEFEAKKETF